jgi:hypothetical protein
LTPDSSACTSSGSVSGAPTTRTLATLYASASTISRISSATPKRSGSSGRAIQAAVSAWRCAIVSSCRHTRSSPESGKRDSTRRPSSEIVAEIAFGSRRTG